MSITKVQLQQINTKQATVIGLLEGKLHNAELLSKVNNCQITHINIERKKLKKESDELKAVVKYLESKVFTK